MFILAFLKQGPRGWSPKDYLP